MFSISVGEPEPGAETFYREPEAVEKYREPVPGLFRVGAGAESQKPVNKVQAPQHWYQYDK